jgi:enterochelin esterase-like enzyme
MNMLNIVSRAAAVLALAALALGAPVRAAGEVTRDRIKVHSPSIEGNLEGNSADRDVIVYLPPSYKTDTKKRYPVIYFLHGFWFTVDQMEPIGKYGEALTANLGKGPEVILVLPNGHSKHAGSMYSNSPTTGNFEGFIAKDLVAHIDKSYRTIATPAARGLGGHSMGGYGTWRVAMKYPGIFSTIYGMSGCCLGARAVNAGDVKIEKMTEEEVLKADFGTRASIASAAAWSPNPNNPPFYYDWLTKDGVAQPAILAQWAANAPLAMVPQYLTNLKSYKAVGIEIGTKDGLIADNRVLDKLFTEFGIKHSYAEFDGGHADKFAERVKDHMIPFFQKNLATK